MTPFLKSLLPLTPAHNPADTAQQQQQQQATAANEAMQQQLDSMKAMLAQLTQTMQAWTPNPLAAGSTAVAPPPVPPGASALAPAPPQTVAASAAVAALHPTVAAGPPSAAPAPPAIPPFGHHEAGTLLLLHRKPHDETTLKQLKLGTCPFLDKRLRAYVSRDSRRGTELIQERAADGTAIFRTREDRERRTVQTTSDLVEAFGEEIKHLGSLELIADRVSLILLLCELAGHHGATAAIAYAHALLERRISPYADCTQEDLPLTALLLLAPPFQFGLRCRHEPEEVSPPRPQARTHPAAAPQQWQQSGQHTISPPHGVEQQRQQ